MPPIAAKDDRSRNRRKVPGAEVAVIRSVELIVQPDAHHSANMKPFAF